MIQTNLRDSTAFQFADFNDNGESEQSFVTDFGQILEPNNNLPEALNANKLLTSKLTQKFSSIDPELASVQLIVGTATDTATHIGKTLLFQQLPPPLPSKESNVLPIPSTLTTAVIVSGPSQPARTIDASSVDCIAKSIARSVIQKVNVSSCF